MIAPLNRVPDRRGPRPYLGVGVRVPQSVHRGQDLGAVGDGDRRGVHAGCVARLAEGVGEVGAEEEEDEDGHSRSRLSQDHVRT